MPIKGTKIRHAIGAVSILAQISLMREAHWQRQQRCCVFLLDKKRGRGGRLDKNNIQQDGAD